MIEELENKDLKKSKPQQDFSKPATPLVALKTCTVELDSATVELVQGCEVHGLTRDEREHLLFHGFVE